MISEGKIGNAHALHHVRRDVSSSPRLYIVPSSILQQHISLYAFVPRYIRFLSISKRLIQRIKSGTSCRASTQMHCYHPRVNFSLSPALTNDAYTETLGLFN